MALVLEVFYAAPRDYTTALAGAFTRNVLRGGCTETDASSWLSTDADDIKWDNRTNRYIDIYYSTWAETGFYDHYDGTNPVTVPRIDNPTAFCAQYHPTCTLGSTDATCPSFCTQSTTAFGDSMRNVELCYWLEQLDLMRTFMDSNKTASGNGCVFVFVFVLFVFLLLLFCCLFFAWLRVVLQRIGHGQKLTAQYSS